MEKRKKRFQRLIMPVLVSALVLTGLPFQGVSAAKAAEDMTVASEEAAEIGYGTESLSEGMDEGEAAEWIGNAEWADEEEATEWEEGPERAYEKAEGTDGSEGTDDPEGPENPDKADKTALAEEIQKAAGQKESSYSAASWKKFQTALDAAKEVNEKEDASQDEIDSALEGLKAAAKALVKVPGKPGSVKAAWEGAKKVNISWTKAADATRYLVYRSYKSSTSGFKKLKEVKATSCKDTAATPGKKAYYKVVAYNGSVKGGESSVKSVTVLKAPASVKASSSKNTVTVSFKKSSGASGYEIWSKTKKKGTYKKAATLTSAKTVKKKFTNQGDGTYYYKVRAYKQVGKKKYYTAYGKEVSVKVKLGSTIENTKSQLAIEADINLKGTGTGYHAKLVMVTPTSAVSFGIQYDQHAVAPYTGKAMALIENVSNNDTGGQRYSRPGNKSLKVGQTYHLMMTVDKNGNGDVYLDYKKIGSFSQPNLAKDTCYLRIEASARLNGDKVDATFSNIKCKWNGKYDSSRVLGQNLKWDEFKTNPGLSYKYDKKKNNIRISGTVRGINGDWDSDYNSVSDILQFQSNGAL